MNILFAVIFFVLFTGLAVKLAWDWMYRSKEPFDPFPSKYVKGRDKWEILRKDFKRRRIPVRKLLRESMELPNTFEWNDKELILKHPGFPENFKRPIHVVDPPRPFLKRAFGFNMIATLIITTCISVLVALFIHNVSLPHIGSVVLLGTIWQGFGLLPSTSKVFTSSTPNIDKAMAYISRMFYGERVQVLTGAADNVKFQTLLDLDMNKEIFVNEGTVYLDAGLDVWKTGTTAYGWAIKGTGSQTTSFYANSVIAKMIYSSAADAVEGFIYGSFCEHFMVDGNSKGVLGVSLYRHDSHKCYDIYTKNCTGDGFYSGRDYITCVSGNNGDAGFVANGVMKYTGCIAGSNVGNGFEQTSASDGMSLMNCETDGNAYGVYSTSGAGMKVNGSYIENALIGGIYSSGNLLPIITGCSIRSSVNNWIGITLVNQIGGEVTGNTIMRIGAATGTVGIFAGAPATGGASNMTITGNTFYNLNYAFGFQDNSPAWYRGSKIGNNIYLSIGTARFQYAFSDIPTYGESIIGDEDKSVYLRAQFDKTTDTALADISGFLCNVIPSCWYDFEAVLYVDADATGGSKFCINGTATFSQIKYEVMLLDNTTMAYTIASRQTALAGAVGQAGTTAGLCIIKGSGLCSAAGTIRPQFAQNASNGTSSVLVASTWRVSVVNGRSS